jgi:hypothetical protein
VGGEPSEHAAASGRCSINAIIHECVVEWTSTFAYPEVGQIFNVAKESIESKADPNQAALLFIGHLIN